jgi:hypothetical protein
MGINYNPRTVTDGLVLALDAANSKSYPGSGTTWTDLSGRGNTGTLTNGPTYSGANGGSIVFDGVDDYLQSPSSTDFVLGTEDFTLEIWCYPISFFDAPYFNNYGALFDFRTANAPETNILLTFLGSSTLVLYVDTGIKITGAPLSTNQWTHVVLSRSSATTKLFMNGTQVGSSYVDANNYTSSTFKTASNVVLNAFFDGYISNLRIYKGKGLTAQEVQQNYNALKSRYI